MKKNHSCYRRRYLKHIALVLLFYPLSALGAQGHISIKGQSITIMQAIQLIEKNSDYTFFYNAADLEDKQRKDINCNGPIDEILDEVFKDSGISYIVKNKEVILNVQKTNNTQQKKKRTVTGTIIDAVDDSPIIGANITIKGDKNTGTISDIDGNFSLSIPDNKTILVVTYIGYKTREVPVEDLGNIKIVLEGDDHTLNEVVVVGSGTQKKVSVTGAITSIKGASLKLPSSTLSNSFAGKLAGVIAKTNSGEPGSGAEFYIRGIGTFGGRATPLILLDDVEISSGDLNYVPAENIESFSILKDASATAIYGSRGANGVMIVTTKGGEYNSKTSINVTAENSFNYLDKFPEFVDGATYMDMYNEAVYNQAIANNQEYEPFYSRDKIDKTRANANPYLFPNNDWYSMLFKDFAVNQNLNISIKGGSKNVDYFLNAGIFYENGIIRQPKEDKLDVGMRNKKYLFQSNVTARVTSTTKVGLNMNTQLFYHHAPKTSTRNLFAYSMHGNPVRFPATLPAEPGDTYIRYGSNDPWDVGKSEPNPYAKLSEGYTERNYVYMTTAFNLEQDLKFVTPGLKLTGLASFYNYSFNWLDHWIVPFYYKVSDDYTMDDQGNYLYKTSTIGEPGEPYLKSNSGRDPTESVWSLQGALDYSRQFGGHDVGATLVYHMKETKKVKDGGAEKDLLPYREQGMAGRLTYSFGQRYLLEATFGYNGSENFRSGHRFGFFPAIALGWTISNEKFFQPLKKTVSTLKIRATYGLTGNDALATRFPYVTEVSMNNNLDWWTGSGTRVNGPLVNIYGNANATWEKSKKLNLGVDMTLLESMDITIDYFKEDRSGIFMQRSSVPSTMGVTGMLPYANIGSVKNKGVDMSVAYSKVIGKDWVLRLNGSLTYAHNEITEIDEPVNVEPYSSRIGHPINSIMGYVSDGLFTSQEEIDRSPKQSFGNYTVGDIKYKDLNGDNVVNGYDRTIIGNPEIPEIIYGFGGTLKYKKWDLSLFFQGVAKVSLMMSDIHPFSEAGHKGYNIAQYIVDDHWSESNNVAGAAYPRLSPEFITNNAQTSTYYLRNAAFLRLKNAELGYSFFPWLRVYAAGTNLLTFSPFSTWDPEMGSGNGLKYPLQRTAKIGIQFHY